MNVRLFFTNPLCCPLFVDPFPPFCLFSNVDPVTESKPNISKRHESRFVLNVTKRMIVSARMDAKEKCAARRIR